MGKMDILATGILHPVKSKQVYIACMKSRVVTDDRWKHSEVRTRSKTETTLFGRPTAVLAMEVICVWRKDVTIWLTIG